MPKQSSHSSEPAEREAGEGALTIVAKGLVEHKALLYGFGVILVISTACQILRVDVALYLWLVFAFQLVCSAVSPTPRSPTGSRRRSANSNTFDENLRCW